ncbi:Uncharacterized protein HZ326_27759 [Fusarium oxysporum f. sp. albedinis]|nr:Uncharacterized protein HZ326_27759 [Fusarium oxysporum f. sp. albedinis]
MRPCCLIYADIWNYCGAGTLLDIDLRLLPIILSKSLCAQGAIDMNLSCNNAPTQYPKKKKEKKRRCSSVSKKYPFITMQITQFLKRRSHERDYKTPLMILFHSG